MKKALMLTTATLIASVGLMMTQPVQANTYTTVPTSLRGHWYHYDSTYGTYDQLKATQYRFDTKDGVTASWYRISGRQFPSYAMGHSQLVVKRTPKNDYFVARYATDSYPYWKKVTHKGHVALRAVTPQNMETDGSTIYWYRSKKIAKHPTVRYHTVSDNRTFYYETYTPVYLQADEQPIKLYTTPTAVLTKSGSAITFNSIYKKAAARWNATYDDQDLFNIRLNGQTYYAIDSPALQKFNTWRTCKTIVSPYAPSSTTKIVLRHGDKVSGATRWKKVTHAKKGLQIVTTWYKQHSVWHQG